MTAKPTYLLSLMLIALLGALPAGYACGGYGEYKEFARQRARNAVRADGTINQQEVDSLRQMGPRGLEAMFTVYAKQIAAARQTPGATTPYWEGLSTALDRVAGQKNAYASELYWYDNMARAMSEAANQKKPILALYLLGELTEERTCVNSRFFRTVLYPDPTVQALLQDDYILVWQKLRDVPQISIDFGDGRSLQQTITGNSIHYVLDAEGKVLDALPGLYGPGAFVARLQADLALDTAIREQVAKGGDADGIWQLASVDQTGKQATAWLATLKTAGLSTPEIQPLTSAMQRANPILATLVTQSKMVVERPMLNQIRLPLTPPAIPEAAWPMLDKAYAEQTRLSDEAIFLMRRQFPSTMGLSKEQAMARFTEQVAAFQQSVRRDTVLNDEVLRPWIMSMLQTDPNLRMDLAALNARVYAEIFRTPLEDPWMGFLNAYSTTYNALDDAGLRAPTAVKELAATR